MHCTFWPTLLMSTLTKQIWRNHLLHFWLFHQSIIKSFSPSNSSSPSWSGSFLPHIKHIVFSLTPLSSTLNFSRLSDFLHGKFFPKFINTWELPFLESFDTTLCEMDSEIFFTSFFWSFRDGFALGCFKPLCCFHNLLCISSIGPFPLGVFPLRSGATQPSLQPFSFLLSSFQTLISSLLRVR